MPPASPHDDNLLLVLLATRLELVTAPQAADLCRESASDTPDTLADAMVARGLLTPQLAELLRRMAKQAVDACDGDTGRALRLLGSERSLLSFHGPTQGARPADPPAAAEEPATGHEPGPDVTMEHPGRYMLMGEQGRGASALIHRAHDAHIGRDVALKELPCASDPSHAPAEEAALLGFLREARITGMLEHPSVVPVYEVGRHLDGRLYYTMKLVKGRTLDQALVESSQLDERLALLGRLEDVCQAIAYAHSKGVVHGDLRADNVMLGDFGETVVLDWGMASVAGGTSQASPAATEVGKDVWGAGAMLYQILAGRPPLPPDQMTEALRGETRGKTIPPVRSLCREAPADLASTAMRALHPDPSRRTASIDQVAADIASFRAGRLLKSHRYSPWELARRLSVRHRKFLVTLLVAVALVGGVLGWQDMQLRRQRATARHQKESTLALAETLIRRHGPALEQLEAPSALGDRLLFRLEQYLALHGAPSATTSSELLRVATDWMDLADLARNTGRPAEERHTTLQALDLLESVDLAPSPEVSAARGRALLRMATLCSLQGQPQRARAFYARAISASASAMESLPDRVDVRSHLAEARCGLGVLLAAQGQSQDALAEFRKALEACRAPASCRDEQDALPLLQARVLLRQARVLARAGREAAQARAQAVEEARKRVRRSPFVASRRRDLAAIELQAGQAGTALVRLRALHESEPRRWRLTTEVAWSALQAGQVALAQEMAQESLGLAGNEPARKLLSLSLSAAAEDLGGNDARARTLVGQALQVSCKSLPRTPWPETDAVARLMEAGRTPSPRACRLVAGIEQARATGLATPLQRALAESR